MKRGTLVSIRHAFNEVLKTDAVKEIEKNYGVSLELGSGSYGSSNATIKLEISDVAEDGTVSTKEAEAFKDYAFQHGLKEEDLGRSFECSGKTFTITGYKPRATKRPITCVDEKGAGYVFAISTVKRLLT